MRLSGTPSQASSPSRSSKWFTAASMRALARVRDRALLRRAGRVGALSGDRRGAERLGGGVGDHRRVLRADRLAGGGGVAGGVGLGALLGGGFGLGLGAPDRARPVEIALLAAPGDRRDEAQAREREDESAHHLRISFQRAISARTRSGAVPPKLVRLA